MIYIPLKLLFYEKEKKNVNELETTSARVLLYQDIHYLKNKKQSTDNNSLIFWLFNGWPIQS